MSDRLVLVAVRPPRVWNTPRERSCRRCGITWQDTGDKYLRTAPCKDCRPVLKRDGHNPDEWLIRPPLRKPHPAA